MNFIYNEKYKVGVWARRTHIACIFCILSAGPILYLNTPFFHLNTNISEPLLSLGLAVACLAALAISRIKVVISAFDISVILLLLYISVKHIATASGGVFSLAGILLTTMVYFSLKPVIAQKNNTSQTAILKLYFIIQSVYLIAACHAAVYLPAGINDLWTQNKSNFCILVSSQLIFSIPLYIKHYHRQSIASRLLTAGLLIGLLILIVATKGRSGWIGIFMGSAFLLLVYAPARKIRRLFICALVLAFAMLIAVVFSFKEGSSNGRLLIYKVSASMIKDNPLFGIGHGRFKTEYGKYQANYFLKKGLDTALAIYADNTYFAFSDVWQFFIEHGTLGFLLLIASVFLLIRNTNSRLNTLQVSAAASLICITMASVFSYPFQMLPTIIQAIFCVILLTRNACPITRSLAFKPIMIAILFTIIVHNIYSSIYQAKAKKAFDLSRSGFKEAARAKYESLSNSHHVDGHLLYLYARELYYAKKLTLAKMQIERAKSVFCSHELYILHAKVLEELRVYEKAEQEYRIAVFMVPNRMLSRSELFEFYLRRRDTTNAIFWGKSILAMPVKIPSATTVTCRIKTESILATLTRQGSGKTLMKSNY